MPATSSRRPSDCPPAPLCRRMCSRLKSTNCLPSLTSPWLVRVSPPPSGQNSPAPSPEVLRSQSALRRRGPSLAAMILPELKRAAWRELIAANVDPTIPGRLTSFLAGEDEDAVYPPSERLFAALDRLAPERVEVVILGQDPYHGPGQPTASLFRSPTGGSAAEPSQHLRRARGRPRLPAAAKRRSLGLGRSGCAASQLGPDRRRRPGRITRRPRLGADHRRDHHGACRRQAANGLPAVGSLRPGQGGRDRSGQAPGPRGGPSLSPLGAPRLLRLPTLLQDQRLAGSPGALANPLVRAVGRRGALPGFCRAWGDRPTGDRSTLTGAFRSFRPVSEALTGAGLARPCLSHSLPQRSPMAL